MKIINSFLSSAILEFQQITWPSRKKTIQLVTIVIVFSVGMAIFLGIADYGFSTFMQRFILKV